MSERNNEISKIAIDAEWFLALKAIRRPLLLQSLTPDSTVVATERKKVVEIKGYNPVFSYSNASGVEIQTSLNSLRQLREQVCQKESNKSIVELYTDKLDELILEQELLLASTNHDWTSFVSLNDKLYGKLQPEYVSEILDCLKNKTNYFELIRIQNDFSSDTVNLKPSAELFNQAKGLISGPDISIDENKEYDSLGIVEAWNNNLNETMPGWEVVIDKHVAAILVSHRQRKIKIPANLKMIGKRMRKLFVHEIGTHVYRREMGKKNKLQLSSISMASSQSFEEGLAQTRAQLLAPSFYQFAGFDKYLTLIITLGYIDGKPKDFNQTFNILKEYFLNRINRKGESSKNITIAENRAWNCTIRVFRGGNPNVAGSCFIRDKIYYEGNHTVWKLLATNPDFFDTVMLGKFNPENSLQRQMVIDNTL